MVITQTTFYPTANLNITMVTSMFVNNKLTHGNNKLKHHSLTLTSQASNSPYHAHTNLVFTTQIAYIQLMLTLISLNQPQFQLKIVQTKDNLPIIA